MPIKIDYCGVDVTTTWKNVENGVLVILKRVIEIIKEEDAKIVEVNAYEDCEDEDSVIEFFIDGGGDSEQYGEKTVDITNRIIKELKLSVYLGQEDYGCLDMIQLDNEPYSQVPRLKEEFKLERIKKIVEWSEEFTPIKLKAIKQVMEE